MNCPRCERDLPLNQFGVARNRKTGRNLYCKKCASQKMKESRDKSRLLYGQPCLCGCGELAANGREYRAGHHFRRMDRSEEWRANISESMKGNTNSVRPAQLRLAPEQRVLFALMDGPQTQKQISRKAGIFIEELGIALAVLILDEKKVASRIVKGDEREYYLREVAA